MDYTIKAFFDRLGLTNNEIKLYLTALELGECNISALAKQANIHRVATYQLVEQLNKKGLISISPAKHSKKIIARDPNNAIESILRNKRRALSRLKDRYEDVLPTLNQIYSSATVQSKVQFFEGKQGLEQIHKDIINTLKELPQDQRITYSYSNPNTVDAQFEDYIDGDDDYIEGRKRYGIINRVIATDGPLTQKLDQDQEEYLLEMIILPEKLFPYKNDITLYHNKMAIESIQKECMGIVIESEDIIQDQRTLFELAWRGAKSLQ